mgnify:CR=1 FL=1
MKKYFLLSFFALVPGLLADKAEKGFKSVFNGKDFKGWAGPGKGVIDIPAEAAFLDEQWVSTIDAPEGTPVHVHVHNHGINSYRVADLSVTYAP